MLQLRRPLFATALLTVVAGLTISDVAGAQDVLPDGVVQLLPRGSIPAVFDPRFVNALEADIPDSARVFGVVLDGEARAYDLNLLNHHEIVNDEIGNTPIAPVW